MTTLVVMADATAATELQIQIERAASRRDDAQAKSTRERYVAPWRDFNAWCAENAVNAANPQIVATYLSTRADAGDKVSTVKVARAAIIDGLRRDGIAFDAKDEDLRRVMAGIQRTHKRAQKSVAPLEGDDLKDILELPANDIQTMRDNALLALGFGHALRGPSELLELDYARLGDGNGWVDLTSSGVVITLQSSKASQETAETLVCASSNVRKHVAAWIVAGNIQPGTPLFRGLRKGGVVTAGRLTDKGMTEAIRRSIFKLMRSRGMSEAEATALAAKYNTHSLRKGCATSLARKGLSGWELQQVTRHKSMSELQKYIILGGQATKPVAELLD